MSTLHILLYYNKQSSTAGTYLGGAVFLCKSPYFSMLFLCNHTKCIKLSENSAKGIDFYTQWVYHKDTIKNGTAEKKGTKTMSYKVIFSGNMFDHTAYFDCAIDCDFFANLMASEGRLVRVIVDGLDITDKFVTIINL